MRNSFAVLGALVSCSRVPTPTDHEVAEPPADHTASCPGVRATWRGTKLELVVDHAKHPIELDYEDVPRANWSFDIFSPDCKHVLLLQSRQGPYHVVATTNLAAYAEGAAPDFVLTGKKDSKGESGAGNLRDGRWVSNDGVEYAWGCCDPPIVEHFKLP